MVLRRQERAMHANAVRGKKLDIGVGFRPMQIALLAAEQFRQLDVASFPKQNGIDRSVGEIPVAGRGWPSFVTPRSE